MTEIARYPSLRGRTVLVTGGGSGIGAAIVRHFAGQGARVGFLDIDVAASTALVAELVAEFGPTAVQFEPCDLRDIPALRAAIAAVAAALGPITILVNNAAHDARHQLRGRDPGLLGRALRREPAPPVLCRSGGRARHDGGGRGVIINLGSNSWMQARGGMPAYTSAKSAVVGLTRALARDLGAQGIRVLSVVPGWIMTERQIALHLTPEGEAELMANQCVKRRLTPDDIARPILFFASEEAAACAMQSYVIDGGWV